MRNMQSPNKKHRQVLILGMIPELSLMVFFYFVFRRMHAETNYFVHE